MLSAQFRMEFPMASEQLISGKALALMPDTFNSGARYRLLLNLYLVIEVNLFCTSWS